MTTITNISPQGDLELPLIGRTVAHGESVDVTPEQAKLLAGQPDVWIITEDAPTIADLRAIAEERGIDITGLKKKADIEAAIANAGNDEKKGDEE